MPRSGLPRHLRTMLAAFDSVEQLDVLLLLRREPTRHFTARSVAERLYLTPDLAEHYLALLCGRGMLAVTLGTDLRYAFRPGEVATFDFEALASAAEDRRVEVAAFLRSKKADPVRAFAEAFRIRRRHDDDDE